MNTHAALSHPLAPTRAIDLGALIRSRRNACTPRMTQAQLGELLGYSAAWVSRVESNELTPPWEILIRIAQILGITPAELGIASAGGERPAHEETTRSSLANLSATKVAPEQALVDQEDDPVRRRTFLAGAAGLGTALTATTTPAVAAPDPVSPLEEALFQPTAAPAMSLDRLRVALAAARSDFRAARYATLGRELPELIAAAEATRDSLTGTARDTAHTIIARAYVLASELTVKAHSEAAWVTADRALRAARDSGQPAPIGEAARVLAIAMRRSGRGRAAVDLLTRTATSLDAEHRRPTAPTLTVRTSLLLTAAYSAAVTGDRTTALALADEAEQSTSRLPADAGNGLFTVDATPQQCALYRIGIHNALGTPDEGIAYARSLAPARLPTPERRARYYTDTARMWHQLGDPRRTFTALRGIEHNAPEEARRPAVRTLTAELTYSSVSLPGLKEYAERTGVHR
ncbi:helix-turn-helix domain-containing protein [Streptomyces aureus]|uniref:helix-turn-helix domain-containing protein n=1 Tax=Streptomyces aureus TaxID=193461 RepID=UPI00099B43D6|nr:helix-turn-helix transcriptional regulator [Streptomyces aureus]